MAIELVRPLAWLTAAWFLAVGASIGSFLNVVVYRLPRGMNLSHPPSKCPKCDAPIELRDNVPVLGWLLLRGRCRSCRNPISPRYPIVEAVVGGLFVLLLYAELLSGGANLPVREPNRLTGVAWTLWDTQWDLLGIYLFHAFLLCTLVAATLIDHDGFRLPASLVRTPLIVAFSASMLFADLHPVPAWIPRPDALTDAWWGLRWSGGYFGHGEHALGIGLAGVVDALAGTLAGFACAFPLGFAQRSERRVSNAGLALVLVGAFLGWQAALSVTAIALLALLLVVRPVERWTPRISHVGVVAAATLLQVLLWRHLAYWEWWPNHL